MSFLVLRRSATLSSVCPAFRKSRQRHHILIPLFFPGKLSSLLRHISRSRTADFLRFSRQVTRNLLIAEHWIQLRRAFLRLEDQLIRRN